MRSLLGAVGMAPPARLVRARLTKRRRTATRPAHRELFLRLPALAWFHIPALPAVRAPVRAHRLWNSVSHHRIFLSGCFGCAVKGIRRPVRGQGEGREGGRIK